MHTNRRITSFIFVSFLFSIFSCSLNAEEGSLRFSRANQYFFQGQLSKATETYKEQEKEGKSVELYLNLGIVFRDLGKYDRAIKEFQQACLLDPGHTRAKILLAETLYCTDRLKEAQKVYQDITDEENWEKHFGLSRVFMERGKSQDAERELEKLIRLNPLFAPAYVLMGRVKESRKDFDKALSYYKEALRKDHTMVEVRLDLARLYEKQKEEESAYREYAQLEDIDSGNLFIKKQKEDLLKRLKKEPEEIIPPKRIKEFTRVEPVSGYEKVPVIRIGIGVDGAGKPLRKKRVSFMVSGDFHVAGIKEKEVLAGGSKDELWVVEIVEPDFIQVGPAAGEKKNYPFHPIRIEPKSPKDTIIIQDIKYAKGFSWAGVKDQEYRGIIEIAPCREGLNVINHINLEEYLYSTLSSEMSTSFPMEALKAQSVIARSVALYRLRYVRPHSKDGYDLCNDQHCQVYHGVKGETKRIRAVVDSTRGEYLEYRGQVAHALYSSTCGGHTQSSEEIGWGKVPYLKGIPDGPEDLPYPESPLSLETWIRGFPATYCSPFKYRISSMFRWVRIKKAGEIEEVINQKSRIGRIEALIPLSRSSSGHVRSLKVLGSKGSIVLKNDAHIRRLLGIGFLRSTLFLIQTKYNKRGLPEEFIFYGGGWGHGVGLCQIGAVGMAEKGFKYPDILSHYYPGTVIKRKQY